MPAISGMKISSKPRFDNTLLKRWLLKVGPVRRKTLLKKFKNNLMRLGLPIEGVRKGLLQLSSRPFVRVIKKSKKQITSKDTEPHNRHCISKIGTKNSPENKKKDKNNNVDFSKLDIDVNPSSKTSGIISVLDRSSSEVVSRRRTEKSKKSRHRSRSDRERRLRERENPNGIIWRLIPIDMVHPPKPPVSVSLLQRHDAQKKKKRERLLAKFNEIFGEDQDEIDDHTNDSLLICEARGTSTESDTVSEETESSCRKSPTFSDKGKKRKKTIRKEPVVTDKKLKTSSSEIRKHLESTNDKTAQIATTSDQKISEKNCNLEKILRDLGLISESEQEPSVITESSMTSVETMPQLRQQSVIFKVSKQHREVVPAISAAADSALQSESESIIDQQTASSTAADPVMESESIINQETASSTAADPALESESIVDQQTASSTAADPAMEFELIINQETDAFEVQTINSTNIAMSDDDTKDTIICSQNENVKNEPADCFEEIKPCSVHVTDQKPLNIRAKRFSRNSLDYDPNPTSTTGIESGDPSGSEMLSSNDRLFGALDNIFLALQCRRHILERQQTASKLAIKRNRQEEVLQAKQEFETKINVFRQELVYLSNKVGTWDGVLRFIAQGLDNRTPNGMKPFTKVEIDAAMREANLKLPSCLEGNESSGIRKKSSVGRVICEIDLTQENDDSSVELCCDSSTDPARSQDQKYKGHDVNEEDWKHGIKNVKSQLPSITEVTTISPQQFESFGEKKYFTAHDDSPCLLCSRASSVACSQCTKAYYCSKSCQELHWHQSHHATCVPRPGIVHCAQ